MGAAVIVAILGLVLGQVVKNKPSNPAPPAPPPMITRIPENAARPPEAPARGTLLIHAAVDGAQVSVDGVEVVIQEGSARLDVAPDRDHQVIVSAPGRRAWRKVVTVPAGSVLGLEAQLPRVVRAAAKRPREDDVVDAFEGIR
jgi:hypothetical protein